MIIVVCIGAITTLGTNANTTFTSVGNTIGSSS
jgi:Flp pilus assembly pilin Flp